jgi:hypothetical protein
MKEPARRQTLLMKPQYRTKQTIKRSQPSGQSDG